MSTLSLTVAMSSQKTIFILAICCAFAARTFTAPTSETTDDPSVEGPDDSSVQPAQGEMLAVADPIKPRPLPTQYQNEVTCLRQGGLCIKKDECPQGHLAATEGLCPLQAHLGVECCHGLSVKERRCSARGGECRPRSKCGRQLWEERAEDCKDTEACCILTRIL